MHWHEVGLFLLTSAAMNKQYFVVLDDEEWKAIVEIVLIRIRADELSIIHAKRHADRIFDFQPGRILVFGLDESHVPIADESALLRVRDLKEDW